MRTAVAANDLINPNSVVNKMKNTLITILILLMAESSSAQTARREFWLVSEPWCIYCPAAKARFLAKGWPEKNIISREQFRQRFGSFPPKIPFEFGDPIKSTKPQTSPQSGPCSAACTCGCQTGAACRCQAGTETRTRQIQKQVQSQAVYGGRTYSGRVCSNPRCAMCNQIQSQLQSQSRSVWVTETVPVVQDFGQEPSSPQLIHDMLTAMNLDRDDVFADLGCGDGRVLIAAARRFGCRCVGVEIDADKASEARENVERSGLSGRIMVITGDVRDFDLNRFGITAATVYLYPELLAVLAPALSDLKSVGSAFHEVPGLKMRAVGDAWVASDTTKVTR